MKNTNSNTFHYFQQIPRDNGTWIPKFFLGTRALDGFSCKQVRRVSRQHDWCVQSSYACKLTVILCYSVAVSSFVRAYKMLPWHTHAADARHFAAVVIVEKYSTLLRPPPEFHRRHHGVRDDVLGPTMHSILQQCFCGGWGRGGRVRTLVQWCTGHRRRQPQSAAVQTSRQSFAEFNEQT